MAVSQPTYHEEILQLRFFFTSFRDSDEAADYVVQHSRQPGAFLLRPSTRTPGGLALTVRIDNTHARHVNVLQEGDSRSPSGRIYYVIRERQFNFFHELWTYYSMYPITNMEHIENVRLLNPIDRNGYREPSNSFSSGSKPIEISVSTREIPPLPLPRKPSSASMSSSVKSGITEMTVAPGAEGGSQRTSLDSEGNDHRSSCSSIGSLSNEGPQFLRSSQSQPKLNGGNLYLTKTPEGGVFSFEQDSLASLNMPTSLQSSTQKPSSKSTKKEDKPRKKKKTKNMSELGWCRPPLPLPEAPPDDEAPYYSTPRPYRDHLDELKLMLRESEMCDCGLRMVDADLADGWTVHRSRESNTFKRVFYQHENGNTTWFFPASIAHLLTVDKLSFILRLCRDSGQDPPKEVVGQYRAFLEPSGGSFHSYPASLQMASNSGMSSSRNWSQTLPSSSTRGGEQFVSRSPLNRNATLDQRRPLPLPEASSVTKL